MWWMSQVVVTTIETGSPLDISVGGRFWWISKLRMYIGRSRHWKWMATISAIARMCNDRGLSYMVNLWWWEKVVRKIRWEKKKIRFVHQICTMQKLWYAKHDKYTQINNTWYKCCTTLYMHAGYTQHILKQQVLHNTKHAHTVLFIHKSIIIKGILKPEQQTKGNLWMQSDLQRAWLVDAWWGAGKDPGLVV